MKTVILCGGQGTRIRDVSNEIPKPMIPIGGVPILWHIMRYYRCFGHREFILCLGYKGHAIKEFFLNYRSMLNDVTVDFSDGGAVTAHTQYDDVDWKVTMIDTGQDTLTGSRVKKIEPYIGDDDTFMLTYGDGVGDIDLDALTAFHREKGALMTISGVRPPARFGEIDHKDGIVTEFNEKPQATQGVISGGFFVCDRGVFSYLDGSRNDETLEQKPMQRIADDGKMAVYSHAGFWQCMDTYRDYSLLNNMFNEGSAPWIRW